ncbi:hypothetical protein ACP8HI_06635 [Paenibacillus sp. FA6]|uniref:hypothetical protein n=1 Tax=Paenibacillus sp. FA6 TaxID=3413029 RepID=UPI003F65A4D3
MKRLGILILLLLTLLLQACGQSIKVEETAQSFSTLSQEESEVEEVEAGEEAEQAESISIENNSLGNTEDNTVSDSEPAPIKDSEIEIITEDQVEVKEIETETEKEIDKEKDVVKKESPVAKTSKDVIQKIDTESTSNDSSLTAKSEVKQAVSAKSTSSGITSIGWSEFFDGEDQTTPSNRFWDLKGSTVTIKGFMGEVLSFDKHWFLLIPEPGAECPFDNGDETYWNKIMIVFVPDDVKLRYKSGPLQITGRLDTGIKIDESGYKTMFRIYDASFEEMKE